MPLKDRALSREHPIQGIKQYALFGISIQSFRQLHSIQQELQQYLSVFLIQNAIAPGRIALYRLDRRSGIAYRSALSLELAAREGESADAIARKLCARFVENADNCPFIGRAIEGGLLEFQLRDRNLAEWLQKWLEGEGERGREGEGERGLIASVFPVQYARARCCSLLRSGHRDKIIEFEASKGRWLHPQPIPWLTSAENGATLSLQHPAEQQLIWRLTEVADVLAGVSNANCLKLALSLSEALLECDRACRIWGEVKRDAPDLAIARLGLLAATRTAIDCLLNEIGIPPLTEL
ncbi:DALR anticodon-binding domain-containing protein [Oscillatoria sp. FACHB-1406]|uniref:DALR anticodon-binding domain-containing protein n=1 Tax=Oscillatoria sp. FACHB-1406 TaxID=2692846 RepID=UPI0016830AE3|nr:DALR anticodon-binding domain-containing protein [Oscillatoria sp. FACHB-1406]MBD2576906.1 hypothetical protein [Oscillatoria sp. FACHB-1406]